MKIIIIALTMFSIVTLNLFANDNVSNVRNNKKVTEIINYLNNNLHKYMKDNDISGASAVIVNKNGILWTKGFGYLSKNSKEAVTPETIFCVGSISKLFTTTGILIASQNGKIDINKSIKYYLPKFKIKSRFSNNPSAKITILDLLGFRSGIEGIFENDKESPLLKQEIEDLENSWLRFPVGQRFAYSNPGYSLAGYILAQIEKKSFSKCIKKSVFSPLGMNSTTFDNKIIKKDKNRAIGYLPGIKKIYFTERPNGSAFSNAVDIGTFLRFQLNNGSVDGKQILSRNNIKLMRTIPDKGQYQTYGFALPDNPSITNEGTVYSYSGLYHGYNSMIIWYPKEDFGFGILTNERSGLNDFMPFFNYMFSMWGVEKNFIGSAKVEIKKIIKKPISLKELNSWIGSYIGTEIGSKTIIVKQNQIGMLQNNKFDKLTYIGDDKFYSVKNEKLYKFIKGGKEYRKYILDMGSGATYNYNDGPNLKKGPDKSEWNKCVGNYNVTYYNRPIVHVKFLIKNGYLYLYIPIFGGNLRLTEYKPGIFVTCSGHIIDFTSKPMLSNNCKMVKITEKEINRK